jgi:hypothetical protein
MSEETPLQESDENHHVTIPYFLYEAMARSYYGQPRNSDVPVEAPVPKDPRSLNLSNVYFNPSDVPPTWRPGGVAARKAQNVQSDVPTPEEEA